MMLTRARTRPIRDPAVAPPRTRRRVTKSVGVLLAATTGLLIGLPGTAGATLHVLTPDAATPSTFNGHGGYSADGLGQSQVGGTVQAQVPAGSTVVQAYLYGTYFSSTADLDIDQRTLDFDGTTVVLDVLANSEPGGAGLITARADVKTQIAAKVGSGGGITDFVLNSDPGALDGIGLVVIYANPASPLVTVAVLDGGSKQAGDTVTLNFASPLNTATPGFAAALSLGSGFSFQGGTDPHDCGGGQFSTVDVNGSRLTSCAGSYDDGVGANGGLVTVGGIGDSLDNPADPNAESGGTDDELYNLAPFLHTGDTSLVLQTSNPSTDDNLFLAVVSITAQATVTTEVCNNNIDDDGDGLIDKADPDCNHPPTANAQAVTTAQDTPKAIGLSGADPDGDPITFAATNPAHGTLSGTAPNLTYTPAAGYSGPDSFTFTTNDAKVSSAPATVSITVTPVSTACSATAPTVDVQVSGDQTQRTSKLTAPKLTTAGGGELILAFVSGDGPASPTQTVSKLTGGGLTWTLAVRSNKSWGTTEVWQAQATAKLTDAVVTATLAKSNFGGSITVVAFKGAGTAIAATTAAFGTTGMPNAKITPTRCNSLVWATGHDWSTATAPLAAGGQSLTHVFIDESVRDSYWTQALNGATAAGIAVTVGDTMPMNDRWTLAVVEIPAP
jgi:hypothetical protein